MSLSSDLISQFVKVTKDDTKTTTKESTVYGTTVEYDGKMWVKLDGSDQLTPVTTTTDTKTNERVTVMIKDHTAVITGNISSPAARTDAVKDVSNQISEFEIVIADKVDTKELTAQTARIDTLVSDNATIKEQLVANKASIETLESDNVTIKDTLTANEASIKKLNTEKLDVNAADIKYATIEGLTATDADIYNLKATYATVAALDVVEANVTKLNTDKLSAEDAVIKYATIDFSNIGKAAIEYFYAKSGLIEDVVVGDGTITGNLVGVTIKGDLIEGNTIVADKLVIKGEDGLYYKLNTLGVTEATYADNYTKTDETIDIVDGTLLDGIFTSTGEQVYSYTDGDGNPSYYCVVDSICYTVVVDAGSVQVEQTDYNSLHGSVITAKSITATQISVSDLVAFDATIGGFVIGDDDETSGTVGSIHSVAKDSAENTTRGIYLGNDGQVNIGDADNYIRYIKDDDGNYRLSISAEAITYALNGSQHSLADLGALGEYVAIGVHEGSPCIELGELDSEFKLVITNNRISFREGSVEPAYIDNQSLHIEKATIENELRFGQFVWKIRPNGNMGLIWEEVSE